MIGHEDLTPKQRDELLRATELERKKKIEEAKRKRKENKK